MLTTCPECRTTFRVGQEQLDDKRGLVRCGHCAAVFNAYDTLLPELSAPPKDRADQEPQFVEESAAAWVMTLEEAEVPQASAAMTVEEEAVFTPTSRYPEADGDHRPPPGTEPLASDVESDRGLHPRGPVSAEAAPSDDILFTPLTPRAPPAKGRLLAGFMWGSVSLLLVLLLALQLIYFMRAEVLAAAPGMRLPIQRFCAFVGCDLSLAKDLSAFRIESTALETDPEDKSRATLNVVLSNRSDRPLAWPHLVLMLTDTRDLPIAQRPFAPGEYLPWDRSAKEGMTAGQELETQLHLELKGLSAYGYKVDIQYP